MSVAEFLKTKGSEVSLQLTLTDASIYLDSQSICWVVLDLKGRPVNVMNMGLAEQFQQALDWLERQIQNKVVKVVIFTSGKRDSFLAGADLVPVFPIVNAKELESIAAAGQQAFERIAGLKVPTIAAINGAALGGGLELALACAYRVVADHKKVQLGLPEVRLGLLPGAGGTVRLPRLIGLQAALQIILQGGSVRPAKAKKLGLVDRVLPYEDRWVGEHRFFAQVRQFAGSLVDGRVQRPVVDRLRTGPWKDRFLEGTPIGRYIVAQMAAQNLDKASKGKYPAPYQALDSCLHAFDVPHKKALEYEAKAFGRCGASPESKALISLFFLTEEAKKRAARTNNAQPVAVRQIGVIGAGVMGHQIAQICVNKKLRVYMRDIKDDIVKKGMDFIENSLKSRVKRGRLSPEAANHLMSLCTGGTQIEKFADCQILIEAAVEQMPLKKKILAECEAATPDNTIFATNTSSLSITELASSATRPQNVVGLHFFNPVQRMPLVEVIRGKQTSDEAAATAYQLALDLGKIPIVCGDCPGFVVNRILGIYIGEAGILAMEGQPIIHLDKALLAFGMPMGPFRLMDEVGLDVAAHVGPILENGLGPRYRQIPEFGKILRENPQHLGKKTGSGFFLYENGKQKGLNPVVLAQLQQVASRSKAPLSFSEIQDRCVLIMLNEAAYILSEGIVSRPEDLDLALVMGMGFAPFTGGLLNYADQRGLRPIVERLAQLEKTCGFRFAPHPLLQKMAANNEKFFPNRPRGMTKISNNPRSKL
eukprot:TRINITY_DN4847_c0_g2_i1.p1 TRINITY_DN4847_c0_g2~~TRINITY_DN4847_c0_g2_i1.p1  ORF type:complete len:763 (-),score=327.56 TRINITY_DN4847_c0_g2_i1:334-2622(-)